jgi:molybdopterin-guanine dinucleotide biosynthesis protein A
MVVTVSPVPLVAISAGGRGRRWTTGAPRLKHLIEIEGQTLLARMIAQAHELMSDARVCIFGPPKLRTPGAELLPPDPQPRPCGVDKILCGQSQWPRAAPVWVLFGDVYFTPEAARAIFALTGPAFTWFGRAESNHVKGWGETFGAYLPPTDRLALLEACEHVRARYAPETAEHVSCRTIDRRLPDAAWLELDDWTEDFDRPIELKRWRQFRTQRGLPI